MIEGRVVVAVGEVVTEPTTVVGVVAEVVVVTDEGLVEDPVVTDADDLVEPLLWVPDDAVVEALFDADADWVTVVVTVLDVAEERSISHQTRETGLNTYMHRTRSTPRKRHSRPSCPHLFDRRSVHRHLRP